MCKLPSRVITGYLGVVKELGPPLGALKSQLSTACSACDLSPIQALAVFFLDC